MAGFVAAGLLRGDHPQIDIENILEDPQVRRYDLLDVRTPEEFTESHIPVAMNIPVDELRRRLNEIPRDRQLLPCGPAGMPG